VTERQLGKIWREVTMENSKEPGRLPWSAPEGGGSSSGLPPTMAVGTGGGRPERGAEEKRR
jgi:hypothetical protein